MHRDFSALAGLSQSGRDALFGAVDRFLKTDQLQDYRPYQKQLEFHMAGVKYRNRLIRAGNQSGKSLCNQTLIPTPSGFKKMGDLEVGDMVFGLDGYPVRVEGVFPQGERDVYRVTVSDGASVLADGEHLWHARTYNKTINGHGRWKLLTTAQMASYKAALMIPDRPTVQGFQHELPVEPYLLGLLIGDGGLSGKSVLLTTADQETVDYCEKIAPEYGCDFREVSQHEGCHRYTYIFRKRRGMWHDLAVRLRLLGLYGKTSHCKFIPDCYKFASASDRLALLHGLMDTDGCVGKNARHPTVTFSTVSDQLADDVVSLAQGLGIGATKYVKKGMYKGERHYSGRVSFRCGDTSLFRLERKVSREVLRPKRRLNIKSIEPEGRAQCTCIKVANEDGMFLAGEGFIPTHNTHSTGAEMAMHLTGEYPPTWKGKRYNFPITVWATSENAEATRDNPQRVLLGPAKQIGTGLIPQRCLTNIYGMAKGCVGAYDFIYIQHRTGGLSFLKFRNYAQTREAWQGPPVHEVWFDEEPPMDKYEEGLARTIKTRGGTALSFTPLLGYTEVVNLYLKDPDPEFSGRHSTKMTLYDVGHLTREEVDAEVARWPKHVQDARINGEPAMGVGQIYPYDPDDIRIEPFEIPAWWPRIAAIDIAGASNSPSAHPTAAVELAWDREADVVYVIREYRRKGLRPAENWMRLRHWGRLKWAWPKDAAFEEKGTGGQVIQLYRNEGMRALPVHAQYPKKKKKQKQGKAYQDSTGMTVSVERGIMDMGGRLEYGGMRVFSTCTMFFEEMRQYHRDEENKVVKQLDDIMDACRYGLMMLRFASVLGPVKGRRSETPDWQAMV